MESPIEIFPESIAASAPDAKLFYRKKSGVVGVIGKLVEIPCSPICEIEADRIAVYRSDDLPPLLSKSSFKLVAVYSSDDSDDYLVPTGTIFIRLEDSALLNDLTKELEPIGFKLARLATFAENAGWLESDNNNIAEALRQYPLLASLPRVIRVEPELLRQSVNRVL